MLVSLFTPTHKIKYLARLYESLKKQTYKNFEWVIVPNGDALNHLPELEALSQSDERIKIHQAPESNGRVGYLKKFACSKCTGDIFFEMDHDDELFETALEETVKAFEPSDVVMVYSNCSCVRKNYVCLEWPAKYGWRYRDAMWDGHKIKESRSSPPDPHAISQIYWAPNHLRAWRASSYREMGGHDDSMKISDDHDLICRSYIHGRIVHIDKCLYKYNVDGENTWLGLVPEIRETQFENFEKYIQPMAMKWADEKHLRKIDICGGFSKPKGFESVDLAHADIIADLNGRWPFEDNSVGVIRAFDALEHLKNPIHAMNEAYRVLAPNGFFFSETPSTDGMGAWCDPTHVSFWNLRSFRYYTEPNVRMYLRDAVCKFQVLQVKNLKKWDNIPYVRAFLFAVKPGNKRLYGYCNWPTDENGIIL